MAGKVFTCRICLKNSPSGESVRVAKGQWYAICKYCKGGTLYPRPTSKQLSRIYDSDKYYNCLSRGAQNPLVQRILNMRLFSTNANWFQRNFEKGRILDVGSGNGEFLYELKKSGWEVWGSDVSQVAVDKSNEVLNSARVVRGEFHKQSFNKKFDHVTFWHVLEHLDSPSLYLQKAYQVLKKGGWVAGEVPNFNSGALRLFGEDYNWVMTPEHLVYLSAESLEKILEEAGFRNVHIYSPNRALLNYALSFKNRYGSRTSLALSPFSVVAVLLLSTIKKGEVLRFKAQK